MTQYNNNTTLKEMTLVTASSNAVKVQFGCGLCAPEHWHNFDVSPSLRIRKIPVLGPILAKGPFGDWPDNVKYGNVITGLPLKDNSVDLLYCSHVLEHLSLEDFRKTLKECHRLLKPNGTFRFVLPDLENLIKTYQKDSTPDASMDFMELSYLGRRQRAKGLKGFIREWLGNSRHLWMWDYKSMQRELVNAGFTNIRRAAFNDAKHTAFLEVEEERRWNGELGVACSKNQ